MEAYLGQDVSHRLLVSFGVWNELALMLSPFEFLKMQALNRFSYNVCISRV